MSPINLDELFEERAIPKRGRGRNKAKRRQRHDVNINQTTFKRHGGLVLRNIKPKTQNQTRLFEEYHDDKPILIHGYAGTGKTFLALYLALSEVLNSQKYEKIIIVRSTVPTRDIGFLPGKKEDKVAVYEAPYQSVCTELFERSDAYELLKRNNLIEFLPTSFVRGVTWSNTLVIVDEIQNMTFGEIDSVVTRIGEGSRLLLLGDYRQTDLKYNDEKRGVIDFMDILDDMSDVTKIEMGVEDIVRSGFVRDYIIAKAKKNRM